MDCVVMCGGRGSRLEADEEKPLVPVAGQPMVTHVLQAAVAADCVDRTVAAVSPHTPRTRDRLTPATEVVDTAGEGYVTDLTTALSAVRRPALTVTADVPAITGPALDRLLARGDGTRTVVVPASLKRALGVSLDEQRDGLPDTDQRWVPTGVNVVGEDTDEPIRTWDARFAVNVNYAGDLAVAERLLSGKRQRPGRES